ncbi:MAG TPA: hypothetical protein VF803_02695 [Candidatus Paceibacterota bacterium]
MNTLAIQHYARRTVAFSAALIVLAVFLYGAFLLIAVERTAKRTTAEAQIATLSSEVGMLQSQYLAEMRTITPERATVLGFVAPKQSDIAYVDENTRALTLNSR